MLRAVFRRELVRQARHPSVWGGAVILGLVAFNDISITSPTASGLIRIGQLPHDAPLVLVRLLIVLSVVASLLIALIAGSAVRTDFERRSYPLLFTTRLTKADYLGGRFLGAVVASGILLAGALAGMAVGLAAIGPAHRSGTGPVPWLVAIASVLPYVVFVASAFFAFGTLTRSRTTVFVSAVIAMVLFFMIQGMFADLLRSGTVAGPLSARLLALADPSGNAALELLTRDWTVAEQASRPLAVNAYFLAHRFFWMAVSVVLLAITGSRFQLMHAVEAGRKRQRGGEQPRLPPVRSLSLNDLSARRSFAPRVRLRQLVELTTVELSRTFKHLSFLVLAGLMLIQLQSNFYENVRSSLIQPATGFLINHGLDGVDGPIILLTLFFAGVLVWRDRNTGENLVTDALPVPDGLQMGAKLSALVGMQIGYAVLVLCSALIVQVGIFGYHRIEPRLYLAGLFGIHLLSWMQVAAGAFFLQAVSPNRSVGYGLTGVALAWVVAAPGLDLADPLFRYGAVPDFTYSDMNGFGPYAIPLVVYQLLWTGASAGLAVGALLFWPRGEIPGWTARLRLARDRLGRGATAGLLAGVLLFLASAAFVVSELDGAGDDAAVLAAYETGHRASELDPEPVITAVSLDVDLWPGRRTARVRGSYALANRTVHEIRAVHVTLLPTRGARRRVLALDRTASRTVDPATGFTTFRLREPLGPGQTAELRFDLDFDGRNAPQALVRNGMILHDFVGEAGFFPLVGYRRELELQDPAVRSRHGLASEVRALRRADDPEASLAASRALVRFEAVVRTDSDQVAAAPGRLMRRSLEGGRAVFRFRADTLMYNEFAVLSGRYAVARDTVRGVEVEILYHPRHAGNVARMMAGTRRGLSYGMDHFGPYPYSSLRIVEVPTYGVVGGTAISKPGLFVWNETGGFVTRSVPEGAVDPVFSTAVHEAAHQWWAHQVRPAAFTEGALTLNETLAQYVRLAGLRSSSGSDAVNEFLADERAEYLTMRNRAAGEEQPLAETTDAYVAYSKGSLAMNSLNRQLGEPAMNAALRQLVEQFALAGPPYATTTDLVRALRRATPDSLNYLIEDWLETITFHEAAVERAVLARGGPSGWQVQVDVSFARLRSDGVGNERPVATEGRVEVAVLDDEGEILGLRHASVDSTHRTVFIDAGRRPASVLIDPFFELMERDRTDNAASLDEPPGG